MDQPKTISSIEPECPPTLPSKPTNLPYGEEYPQEYASITFNTKGSFPTMDTTLAHIHINDEATPHVRHSNSISSEGSSQQSIQWCTQRNNRTCAYRYPCRMVHNNGYHTKENGKICRTIHLQHLNRQCKRDTSLPFSFPASMSSTTKHKQTHFDAVDGYHAIPLDDESQPFTTFITEWGRYRYLRYL